MTNNMIFETKNGKIIFQEYKNKNWKVIFLDKEDKETCISRSFTPEQFGDVARLIIHEVVSGGNATSVVFGKNDKETIANLKALSKEIKGRKIKS